MKKLVALLLAVMMVMALCACGDKAEETTAPAAEPAAAPAAAEAAPAAEAAAPAATGDLEGYKAYVGEYAQAGAPSDDEKAAAAAAIAACTTVEEVEACTYLTPMFSNEIILTYDAWIAAGCPAADTSNMSMGDPSASGEPSGEPSGEIAE